MADLASFMATVRGRVQGVFFRASVMRRARELGLTGYVRNRHDGSVEVCAEGDKQRLERLEDYLQVGPPGARVQKVETRWSDYTGDYTGFGIEY
jgi:acylphosphatase